MYYKCCVCERTRQDTILHHFPCNEKRFNKWLKYLNRDDLKSLPLEQLAKLFVCQKHFEARFIGPKSRLISFGYPALLTEVEISSGRPSQEETVK